MFYKSDKRFGGAALEYLIVSVFASALALSLMTYSSRYLKRKLSTTFEKLGLESVDEEIENLFPGG